MSYPWLAGVCVLAVVLLAALPFGVCRRLGLRCLCGLILLTLPALVGVCFYWQLRPGTAPAALQESLINLCASQPALALFAGCVDSIWLVGAILVLLGGLNLLFRLDGLRRQSEEARPDAGAAPAEPRIKDFFRKPHF